MHKICLLLLLCCKLLYSEAQCFQYRQSADLIVYGRVIAIDTLQVDGLPVLPEYFEGKRLNKDSVLAAINRKNEQMRVADSLRIKAIEEKASHQEKGKPEVYDVTPSYVPYIPVFESWTVISYKVVVKSVTENKKHYQLAPGDTIRLCYTPRLNDVSPKLDKGKRRSLYIHENEMFFPSLTTPTLLTYYEQKKIFWINPECVAE